MFGDIPWDIITQNLREQADATSGIEGGILGAGLGVVTVMSAMKAAGHRPTAAALLTCAAIGIAYGATDKQLLRLKD